MNGFQSQDMSDCPHFSTPFYFLLGEAQLSALSARSNVSMTNKRKIDAAIAIKFDLAFFSFSAASIALWIPKELMWAWDIKSEPFNGSYPRRRTAYSNRCRCELSSLLCLNSYFTTINSKLRFYASCSAPCSLFFHLQKLWIHILL